MYFFKKLKDYLRLRAAINMADEAHRQTGNRNFVLPTMDGRLIVFDRKNFRVMKHKKYIGKDVTMLDVFRECFYFTPNKAEGFAMSPEELEAKKEVYYSWCKSIRKRK